MSFILLGKYADEHVVLLSDVVYGSRKDATDALAAFTADPSFAHWDAEVCVVDVDKGTPILLVRPTTPAAAEALVEETAAPVAEEVEPAAAEDEPVVAAAEALVEAEETESLVVEEETSESETVAVAPNDADLSAALYELGLGDEPAPEPAEPQVEPADAEEGGSLRDALQRTAEQMAASGITPPESVGPSEVPEVAGQPDDGQAWPWASEAEKPAEVGEPFSLAALEEPGVDEGSLIKAAGDDETVASARPVILGDYDDLPAIEPMSMSAAETSEPSPVPTAVMDEPQQEASAAAVEPAPVVAEASGPIDSDEPEQAEPHEAGASDDLSCGDCVYFHTCPNKEEREPSSCGSFQWK